MYFNIHKNVNIFIIFKQYVYVLTPIMHFHTFLYDFFKHWLQYVIYFYKI